MTSRAGFLVAFGWTAAAALLAGGCATSRPIHYYTLASPQTPQADGSPDGPTIVVSMLETPEFLEDERIHYRVGAHGSGSYELHRWTQRPGAIVRDALINALRASGKYRRVMEASSLSAGDYLMRGKIHEFGEVDSPAIATRISLHLELIDQKNNREVWDRSFARDQPASGKTMDDVVESMDRNLQQIVQQAAVDIARFVALSH